MNRTRAFVTTAVAFTFLVVGVTGVIFKFAFKTHPLEQIHGWLGVALVAAALLHAFQNGRPLSHHLRDGRVYLLLVPILAVIGVFTLGQKPEGGEVNPRAILQKLTQARLQDAARAFGQDPQSVLAAMQADGLRIAGPQETLQEVAKENHRPPDAVLGYFVKGGPSARQHGEPKSLPSDPSL